jgi:hypothetical protein
MPASAPQPPIAKKALDQNSTTLNSALLTSHNGQRQSSGMSENRVPGAMPSSGSPAASSYTHPQIRQTQLLYSITSLTALLVLSHLEIKTIAQRGRTRPIGHAGRPEMAASRNAARYFTEARLPCDAAKRPARARYN